MSYKLETFGTYTLPNYDPENDLGAGDPNLSTIDLPGGGAFDALGSDPAPIGAYDLMKRCTAYNEDVAALKADFYNLRSWYGKRDKLYRRIFSDNSLEWAYARFKRMRGTRKPGDKFGYQLELIFEVLSPTWSGAVHSHLFTKAQIAAASGVISLTNAGNVNQDDVIITVTGSGSNITGVVAKKTSASGSTIYNDLTWTGVLAAGQQLVIDCGAYTVKKQGDPAAYDTFALGAGHQADQWFRLWASANRIEVAITGGDNAATIKFDYYDALR
jgi:hypothetical protein